MQYFADADRLKARFVLGLLVVGFGVVILALGGGDALAQSSRDLANRIDRLEKEIETLSRALFRGEEPPAGAFSGGGANDAARANMEVRLTGLESELRDIRGKLEEQSFEIRGLKEELARFKGDLEMRVDDLEGGARSGGVNGNFGGNTGGGAKYINRAPASGGSQNDGTAKQGYQWNSGSLTDDEPARPNQLGTYQTGGNGGVSGSADLAAATYENAFSLLKQEKYDMAEREFQVFLNQYPNHSLAGNAKYWLGETYYVRGDFEKAARLFAEGFQKYPNNSKSADNLLKLGMSLAALDKKDDACVALSQIEKEGFKASAPVLRRAGQEKTRLGC